MRKIFKTLLYVCIVVFVVVGSLSMAQAAKPLADIVFIIDESGSMQDDITAVKANVNNMANTLGASLDSNYALVGMGATASHPGGSSGVSHTHVDLTNVTNFSLALNELVASGGFEPGVQSTIYAMNNVTGYRANAGVCVVLITDEDSDGGDLATARTALDGRNAIWFGIVNPYDSNTAAMYGPNAGSLSAHTGGAVFNITDFRNDPQPVLDALLNECNRGINPLNLSKVSDIAEGNCAPAGSNITYDICFDNTLNPNMDVTNVSLVDDLPTETSFVSATDGGVYDSVTHTVTWGIGTLVAGQSNQCVQVIVQVDPNASGTAVNNAEISSDQTGATHPVETKVCVLCGNGTIETGEVCDDGNLVNEDGCDDTCHLELGKAHEICNSYVNFIPIGSTYRASPDTSDCGSGFAGTFSFDAELKNTSPNMSLSDNIVVVVTLSNGNLLRNADGGPGGVGATLTVPLKDDYLDGYLTPGESVDVPFDICLTSWNPFNFWVDVSCVVNPN